MGGSCSMPLAAYATLKGDQLNLDAAWGDPEGNVDLVTAQGCVAVLTLADAEALGTRTATALRASGAR